MSETRASPSWLSRSRDTASYSYRPCCALVVDLMCQVRSGAPSALATSSASTVLPVPGSPFISSGRSSTIEALSAILWSSEAPWSLVSVNFIEHLPCWLFLSVDARLCPKRKRPLHGRSLRGEDICQARLTSER